MDSMLTRPDAVYSFHLFGVKDQDVDFQPSSKSIRTLDDETRPEVDAMALAAPTQLEAEPLAWNRLRLSWMPPAEVHTPSGIPESRNFWGH